MAKKKYVVNVKLSKGAKMPKYAHDGDLGMDIVATNLVYDAEHDNYIYHTGIRMESFDKRLGCFIMLRSSNRRTDAYLTNCVGLVETFLYRGEFILTFKRRTSTQLEYDVKEIGNQLDANENMLHDILNWFELPWYKRIFSKPIVHYPNDDNSGLTTMKEILDKAPYEVGEKIGQIVWLEFPEVELQKVNELSETVRGEGGHGSTGK
jgi:dUTPase